jgi:GTP-binding protein
MQLSIVIMFIDEVEIYVKAGSGGDGAISFRREKYIPKGGPDGGDGGKGGDIVFQADDRMHGLSYFTRKKRFLAENGQNGMGKKMSGRNGDDLTLNVPPGTSIYQKGELIKDLTEEGETFTFLHGGNGGWGNQHFATSIKQAPTWAKEGQRGESAKITLELKTIADVGLIGLPNAGKSTLLSAITSAKPKIADYPFTTLEPNLGTYIDKDQRIIFADIPGLIEGASKGKGLGDKFLKHIERTSVLVHLIDANTDDSVRDYRIVREELANFSKNLAKKKELVVLNKIDAITDDEIDLKLKQLQELKLKTIAISAVTHKNTDKLIAKIKKMLQ